MTATVEFRAPEGLTLDAALFAVNSDVVAVVATSVTEQANVKGMYLAEFAAPAPGIYLIVCYISPGNSQYDAQMAAYVYIANSSGTYRSGFYADVVCAASVDLMRAIAINKTITDPVTGVMTVMADDDTTPLLAAQMYEDVAQVKKYRGLGAEVRERLEPVP